MRYAILLVVLTLAAFGCARDPTSPPTSATEEPFSSGDQGSRLTPQAPDGRYRLWGEWSIFIDETHTKVDVAPRRQGRFHLNALKFLEDYCKDCLQITSIHNNGDGTIDLTVRITHPFPGHPEFTGFDVKGIIMFQGSHEISTDDTTLWVHPLPFYPDFPRASWRLMGDPELLNADGYSYYWSPSYDSGSDLPIFNYWEGKYSNGTPTANVNGYLNFYSDENRHMFECDKWVSGTYHIWLPPGPVVAGYAVDACWQPPLVTPVMNPIEDFPITANQPEPYHFNCVINDGQPIIDDSCCNEGVDPPSVHEARAEIDLWYVLPEASGHRVDAWTQEFDYYFCLHVSECDGPPSWYCMGPKMFSEEPNGVYQLIAVEHHVFTEYGDPYPYPALDLFEVVIDVQ